MDFSTFLLLMRRISVLTLPIIKNLSSESDWSPSSSDGGNYFESGGSGLYTAFKKPIIKVTRNIYLFEPAVESVSFICLRSINSGL
mmetsp:Transcript_25970/g.29904  ORF Transcript_25970/g.29904 Transcript_25970/m.29904 type:complete len:86 (-) Transcript_25970:671-928(-)